MMPIAQLKDQLRGLHLKDMAEQLEAALDAAHQERHGHLAFLAKLVATQLAAVENRSIKTRINKAKLPDHMTFDTFDWNFQPGLNVEHLKNLGELTFVENRKPLLILGKTGTGKTHIAVALGNRACEAALRVAFYDLQDLLTILYATLADDSTAEFIAKLARLDLLIIDNVSYIRTRPEYPSLLLDLIRTCQDRVALIVTSNISLEEWAIALGNATLTTAIVDRLFHRASVINIRPGRSYRSEGPHAPKLSAGD